MAYSLTSAANVRALVDVIQTFAVAQGWTVAYSVLDATNGKQLGLSNAAGARIAIGEQSASLNPIAVTGGLDARLYMTVCTAFVAPLNKYWGHTGSLVATAADTDRATVNDLYGPMTEVHLFGDADYIMVLVKSSVSRWTHFGFGCLDTMGASAIKPYFCFGNYFEYWNATLSSNYPIQYGFGRNNSSWFHSTSSQGAGQFQFIIPSGILNTALGFSAGAISCLNDNARHWNFAAHLPSQIEVQSSTTTDNFLDMATQILPQPSTGGTPLWSVPVIYCPAQTALINCWLGEIPGLRVCRVGELVPGAEITYSTETWLTAPWKQKGIQADIGNGLPNSIDFGIAFRKS